MDSVYLGSVGASGGVLVMWARRVVEILEEVVGQGTSWFLVGLKMWLINLNGNLLECMGLILTGQKIIMG